MNILVKVIVVLLGVVSFSPVMALGTTTATPGAHVGSGHSLMVFQVIQNQMVFDSSTVESATIVAPIDPTDTYGVNIKLKTIAANKFGQLTENGIGKHGSIVLNGIVISSPIIRSKLGAEFLVTGLTKEQADQFIESLISSPK